ncbi:hypothetical protein EVAR_33376_1 [Eumeta japonica]|uniref:Uncharacterized protein n=1 Tax=Eumeta variegata TaxID=151549 RepID=A0A4C1X1U5_EUMVA|nr:hypothetical protein EVAR_33376_1 [Eumeta japonica]
MGEAVWRHTARGPLKNSSTVWQPHPPRRAPGRAPDSADNLLNPTPVIRPGRDNLKLYRTLAASLSLPESARSLSKIQRPRASPSNEFGESAGRAGLRRSPMNILLHYNSSPRTRARCKIKATTRARGDAARPPTLMRLASLLRANIPQGQSALASAALMGKSQAQI